LTSSVKIFLMILTHLTFQSCCPNIKRKNDSVFLYFNIKTKKILNTTECEQLTTVWIFSLPLNLIINNLLLIRTKVFAVMRYNSNLHKPRVCYFKTIWIYLNQMVPSTCMWKVIRTQKHETTLDILSKVIFSSSLSSGICTSGNGGKHRRDICNMPQYTCTIPYKNLENVKENNWTVLVPS
jgi:hypothetical protein